jgi:hypothetical protein
MRKYVKSQKYKALQIASLKKANQELCYLGI